MSFQESSHLAEEERKKKEKSEKEKRQEQERILEFQKKKEAIHEEEETHDALQNLRDLLEDHIIDDALVEKVLAGDEINQEEMQEIFEKIDEIENMDDIDDYIPKEMRITKEEYTHALHDEAEYKQVMQKLHSTLGLLSQHITPQNTGSVNIFSGFVNLLDQNLITLQEHHIDMKDSLAAKANSPAHTTSMWESIKSYFS